MLTLIVLGKILLDSIWGGGAFTTCLCFDLFISKKDFFYFELKLNVFVMTKAVSNEEICLLKSVIIV